MNKKVCNICSKEYNDIIPATGKHKYKATKTRATVEKNGKVIKKCSKCNVVDKHVIYRIGKVILDKKEYYKTGKSVKPKVKVKDVSGKEISEKYYDISYKNNRKAGRAVVSVKFRGLYKGIVNKQFVIHKSKGKNKKK